jgi:putative addiction module component (TIGR02574 family)
MQLRDIPEISKLSIPEKILLLGDLWDSIISDEDAIPIPESHKQEIRKRIASLDSIGKLLTLDELKARIDTGLIRAKSGLIPD